jgi:GT2 family glycosyltransferase
MSTAPRQPAVSVIVATYNRGPLLVRLLRQIAVQDFPMSELEVVVVDDGSKEPAKTLLQPLKKELPYRLEIHAQKNGGAAAARQRAATEASGEVLLIVDDDMQLEPWFVAEHMRLHREEPGRICVIGRYASDPALASMPLFERYHAKMWDRLAENVRMGRVHVTGTILATGNASMRRDDFLAVGGFDTELRQSEDSELGLKLERAGVRMVFSEKAYSLHGSDHTRLEKWLGRNYGYGANDLRVARKHPWAAHADPWRFVFSLPRLGLPFVMTSVFLPAVSRRVSSIVMSAALQADRLGLEALALRGAGVVFGMEYFRGVREENGSLGATAKSFGDFLVKAARSPEGLTSVPGWVIRAVKRTSPAGRHGGPAGPAGSPLMQDDARP